MAISLAPQRRVDRQAGYQVSGYAGMAAGHGSRDAVVVAYYFGGADGEIGADFLFAERGPHIDVRDPDAVRATGMGDEPGIQRLLTAVESGQRWASVSRADSNAAQRLVKTAGLRAAAASRGASSAASSEDISLSNCSGSIAVTGSLRRMSSARCIAAFATNSDVC